MLISTQRVFSSMPPQPAPPRLVLRDEKHEGMPHPAASSDRAREFVSLSKGAVYSLVGALGNAYPKENVFVNGVEPGRALTDMVVPRFTPEFLANPGNPMGRYSDPEEVAEVVEFLTSERNTYTTGSVWSVKGSTG